VRAKGNRRLHAYMVAVIAAASPLIFVEAQQSLHHGFGSLGGENALVVALFSAVLIVGEMWPIAVARGREAVDQITVSSTFGFALLLIAPVIVVIAAQAVALVIDDIVRHRPANRAPFNISQYALAFIAARYVYATLAGLPFTPMVADNKPDLLAALLAGATFLILNNVFVGIAVALSLNLRLHRVLLEDLAWQVGTSAPLLGMGPLAAQAMAWTPWALVLILVPIVALHRSGRMAMRREQEALRDNLTGLANRTMLTSATERALSSYGSQTAMLLLDLDHFKEINDTLGHAVGDEMLIMVAKQLKSVAGSDDLVARLGGDEFVVLCRGMEDQQAAITMAERLCAAVREPVTLRGVTLTVGCSVGIAFGPEHADTVSTLLRCADVALYSAKETRDTAVVYSKQADRHSAALLGLQADLRAALEDPSDTQVWVAYQPQFDIAAGRIASVECLARWDHPEIGPVPPDTFIPIAENTSIIDLLLDRILDRALAQIAHWDREGLVLNAAVNLSARQISDEDLPTTVLRYLERHGLPARRLLLEVTESRLMADPERCASILNQLHGSGVQISIDDFGTGYSSLSYLQRLAVDELKIDKSFVTELRTSGDETIVRSTVDLGHNLGLRVTAEGVEDQQTAERLVDIGCDVLQGYLIGRPTNANAVAALIATGSGLDTSSSDYRRALQQGNPPSLALIHPDASRRQLPPAALSKAE
jgi:diguanylate cyclase (GGDEF)-like protein